MIRVTVKILSVRIGKDVVIYSPDFFKASSSISGVVTICP